MATLLARELSGRTLVIASPHLLDENNPGSWRNVFLDFSVRRARFESIGKLDALVEQDLSNPTKSRRAVRARASFDSLSKCTIRSSTTSPSGVRYDPIRSAERT